MWFATIKSILLSVCLCFCLYFAYSLISSGGGNWGWFVFIALMIVSEFPSAEIISKNVSKKS